MRYAAGAADGTDAAVAGADANAALPPAPIGMPFSRRGRRRRQAPGDTGSVLTKLLMKMIVYGIVIVAMKYGKKEGKDGVSDSVGGPPTSGIVSRMASLLNDVLGKSGDRALLPGTKTLRVGTGDDDDSDRAANVYAVPSFLPSDVASRWRDSALYEFERSGGSIPESHPLINEVTKTLASSVVQRKFHALGIDDVEGDTAHIASYGSILSHVDSRHDIGQWTVIIPLSDPDIPVSDPDASSNQDSMPTIQFACVSSHSDEKTSQKWCDTMLLEPNTAIVLEGAAKFEITTGDGPNNQFGVFGTFQKKVKEEL